MRGSQSNRAFALILATFSFGLFNSTATAQSYFYNRADFPTGNYPTGVAIADFNGDGRMDVAIANSSDSTVSVLLGKPDGTLAAKTDIPIARAPRQVVVGDFNGDGNVDLAISNSGDTVSILLGNGDGSFQARVDYPTGQLPYALTVGDFNHDGKLDLAVANYNCSRSPCGPGTVSILLGNGDGTFQPKTDYETPPQPGTIIAADFNADGKLDLAVTSFLFDGNSSTSVSRVSVLLGNGDGTFQPHVAYATDYATSGLAAADFNGDGKLDLIVAAQYPDLLLGNGDGTFQAMQPVPNNGIMGAYGVVAADLNHDGKMDFVIANVFAYGISVFLGKGNGTFQPQVDYMANPGQGAMAMGDVNGDGALDVALTDWSGGGSAANTVTVLLGNGDGTFSPRVQLPPLPPYPIPYNPGSLANYSALGGLIADFNGDGKPDLLATESTTYYGGEVAVFPGHGDGTLGSPVISSLSISDVATADFNGDGKPDLAFSNNNGAGIALGNGDGSFGSIIQFFTDYGTPARSVVTGDFNNDGKADVVISQDGSSSTPPVIVCLGNGDGTFRSVPFNANGTQLPFSMVAADFNGDGKLDLAVGLNAISSNLEVLLGNGDGTFASPVFYTADSLPQGMAVADFNGDGIPDLVTTGNTANVLLGNGNGTFQAPVHYNAGQFPEYVVTGDFNGDGKVDLAVTTNNSLSILLGNGNGTFQPPVGVNDGSYPYNPAAGDLNQDGVTDLFTGFGSGSLFLSRPLVSLFPGVMNFAPQAVGTQSLPLTLTVTNVGTGGLSLSNVGATGEFAATNNCNSTVSRGGNCTIDVTFSPTSLGPAQGTLTLIDNTAMGAQAVPLFSIGGVPTANLSTSSLTFASQPVGTTSSAQTFTLTNTGNWALSISSITTSGDYSQQNTCGSIVAAGSDCTISVTFSPVGGAGRTGTLRINDDALNSPQTVTLSGTGAGPGFSLSSPLVFASQWVGTTSSIQTVTLTNTGNADLTLLAMGITGPFAIASSGTTCSTSNPVAAAASCTVAVTFTPTLWGSAAGILSFGDSLPTSPQSLALSGMGIESLAYLTTTRLAFNSLPVGSTSSMVGIGLVNSGNVDLAITSIVASGDFAQTNSCGTSLPANTQCGINVTFTPTSTGNRTGSITITDNASNSPQTVTLTGTGTAPVASLSATSLTFSGQLVSSISTAQAVTLNNTGNVALNVTSIVASGDFAQTNTCGSIVAAGSGCTINVTFMPTASGSRTGAITITDNAANSPQTIALSGTGTVPVASLSATSLTFASQLVSSTSSAQAVTLNNTGTAAMTVASIVASGDFAQTNTCGASIAAGSGCTINVTFTPTAGGSRTGAITITDNAPGSPQTIGLTGTGLAPVASLSSTSLAFPTQLVGSTSSAQSLTLNNTGTAPLTLTSIVMSGDFAQTNTCGSSLAAGATCTFNVTFAPMTSGTRPGSIILTHNAGDSPQTISLTGRGADFTLTVPTGSSTTANVNPGQSANYSLSLGGLGGLNQAINFTCTGAPSESTCTVNPTSVVPAGSGSISFTVTVTTAAATVVAPIARRAPPMGPGMEVGIVAWSLLGLLALASLAFGPRGRQPRGKRLSWGLGIATLALLAIGMTACGGGGGGGGGGVPHDPGTPTGTYTLTVTGTAAGPPALQHSMTLTLKVG